MAFFVVALQQAQAGLLAQHGSEFPGQVVGVGNAGVAAARAKRADHLGRVTNEEDAAMPHAVNAFAAVGVGPNPDHFNTHVRAKLQGQALAHHVFTADVVRVRVGGHLVVDAPHVVGHQVLPDSAVLIERRLNPSVALGRRPGGEAHVGNAPAVVPLFGGDSGIAPAAERAVCASGVDHVGGVDLVGACRGGDAEGGRCVFLGEGCDAAFPTDVHMAELQHPFDQKALDVELLEVDERRLG